MRIMLTGAAGQLGRALQDALSQHAVTPLDRAQLDISSLSAVRDAIAGLRPDLAINAAAYTNVDGAEADPAAAYRTNALGARNLAVATAAHCAVLHVSTDYVFDGNASRPYHEFDRVNPRSVYGASKLAGEEAVRSFNPRHYIVRTAWLYDTRGRNFLRAIVDLAARGPVRVVNDQFGSPTYVPHLAEAIARLITSAAYGTYHLAGHGGTSWFGLTCALLRQLRLDVPVQPVATADVPRPAERPRYAVLTTLQDPHIVLPPWEEGVVTFARLVQP